MLAVISKRTIYIPVYIVLFLLLQNGNRANGAIPAEGVQAQKDRKTFESFEDTPLFVAILTYLSYAILIVFGHLGDFLRKKGIIHAPQLNEENRPVSNKIVRLIGGNSTVKQVLFEFYSYYVLFMMFIYIAFSIQ